MLTPERTNVPEPFLVNSGTPPQLGERFHPDQIILFGSYAYGEPHADSDADLLVVMPTASEVNQSIRMMLAFEPPFALDLIVRTPAKLQRRLAEGSSFLQQIITRGKVLYEEEHENGATPILTGGKSKQESSDGPFSVSAADSVPRKAWHRHASRTSGLLPSVCARGRPPLPFLTT